MKKSLILALLTSSFSAFSAHAAVVCTVSVPEPAGTGNYAKDIYSTTVVENPSNDPRDRRRSRYILVRPDLSAAYALPSENISDEGLVSDPNARPGDTVIWVQEITSPGYYAIDMSTLTADLHLDPNWDGATVGQIPPGADLSLTVPRKQLAIGCRASK